MSTSTTRHRRSTTRWSPGYTERLSLTLNVAIKNVPEVKLVAELAADRRCHRRSAVSAPVLKHQEDPQLQRRAWDPIDVPVTTIKAPPPHLLNHQVKV